MHGLLNVKYVIVFFLPGENSTDERIKVRRQDSGVVTVTSYGLDVPGFGSVCMQASYSNTFRSAVGLSQRPVQCIPGRGRDDGDPSPSNIEVRDE
jgi:hypothetical protein